MLHYIAPGTQKNIPFDRSVRLSGHPGRNFKSGSKARQMKPDFNDMNTDDITPVWWLYRERLSFIFPSLWKLKWQLEFSWLMLDRCLSNMRWATSLLVQVPLVKPNQLWPIKAWCPDVRSGVPYGIWHWNGCSGVCFWRPGPPWIRLVPTRPTDCRSDWDLGRHLTLSVLSLNLYCHQVALSWGGYTWSPTMRGWLVHVR